MPSLATLQSGTQIKLWNSSFFGQGNLNVYIQNEMLMHNHCMEIVGSLGLKILDSMLSVDD